MNIIAWFKNLGKTEPAPTCGEETEALTTTYGAYGERAVAIVKQYMEVNDE